MIVTGRGAGVFLGFSLHVSYRSLIHLGWTSSSPEFCLWIKDILVDVLAGLFPGVDLAFERLGFGFHSPLNVRGNKRHVVVVLIALGIEDSDLLAHLFKGLAFKGKLAHRQSSGVESVLLILCQSNAGQLVVMEAPVLPVHADIETQKRNPDQHNCQD